MRERVCVFSYHAARHTPQTTRHERVCVHAATTSKQTSLFWFVLVQINVKNIFKNHPPHTLPPPLYLRILCRLHQLHNL